MKTITDSVHRYLDEIRRISVLTHEQMIVYGKQVQRLQNLYHVKEKLAHRLEREPTWLEWYEHSHISERELRQAIANGKIAKRKMIEANLRLVVSIAKRYRDRNSGSWTNW